MKPDIIFFDMDGVLFKNSNFWMRIHKKYDTLIKGMDLNKKFLKTDTIKLADEVIGKLWKGKDAKGYWDIINSSEYNLHAKELFEMLKEKEIITCILTSGPLDLAKRAQKDLDIDYIIANEIEIKDKKITGKYSWFIEWGQKGEVMMDFCVGNGFDNSKIMFVGDNEDDISACKKAHFSIAFNSESEELKKESDVIIDEPDLIKIWDHID